MRKYFKGLKHVNIQRPHTYLFGTPLIDGDMVTGARVASDLRMPEDKLKVHFLAVGCVVRKSFFIIMNFYSIFFQINFYCNLFLNFMISQLSKRIAKGVGEEGEDRKKKIFYVLKTPFKPFVLRKRQAKRK